MKHCPHPNIYYCPLYRAAHEAIGHGCDDGRLGEHDGCAVSRGGNYERMLAALHKCRPDIIKDAAMAESEAMAREQRKRNKRAAGLR
jgi:hypothetical protein